VCQCFLRYCCGTLGFRKAPFIFTEKGEGKETFESFKIVGILWKRAGRFFSGKEKRKGGAFFFYLENAGEGLSSPRESKESFRLSFTGKGCLKERRRRGATHPMPCFEAKEKRNGSIWESRW